MRTLWTIVVCLALVYLAVWQISSQEVTPNVRPTHQVSIKDQLTEEARGDLIGRIDPHAQTTIESVAIRHLDEKTLRPVGVTKDGKYGFEIIIKATLNKRDIGHFRYYALPPDRLSYAGLVKK